jgi:competence protein ComEC
MVTFSVLVIAILGFHKDNRLTYKHNILFVGLCLFSMVRIMMISQQYSTEVNRFTPGEQVVFEGLVNSIHTTEKSYIYEIGQLVYRDHSFDGTMSFITNGTLQIGDVISGSGEVLVSDDLRNEGGFDQIAYNKQKNRVATVYGEVIDVEESKGLNLQKGLYLLRQQHEDMLYSLLPKSEADIVGTLLLGSNLVESETKDLYRVSGLIHILAISGLHVTLIGIGLFRMISFFIRKKQISAIITISLLIVYCIYTGLHTSTVRATIMIIIFLSQYIFNRRYDKTTALFLAATVICIFKPLALFDIGFLLSFGAVMSIFYIEPKLRIGWLERENEVISSLRVMLAIQIGITPILTYVFFNMPLYGLIANLLVLPVVALIILFSLLGLIFTYGSVTVGGFFIGSTHWLVNYMTDVTKLVSTLPWSYLNVGKVPIVFIMAYYLLLFTWVKGLKFKYVTLGLSTLVTIMMVFSIQAQNQLEIHMLDVGQGDSVIITYKGEVLMIDGGGDIRKKGDNVGKRILDPFFQSKSISVIDTVFVTHSDFDHLYGIIELAQTYTIKRLIISESYERQSDEMMDDLLVALKAQNTDVIYFGEGDEVAIDDLKIRCLGPRTDFGQDNNSKSLILLLQLESFDALFMGDAGVREEEQLIASGVLGGKSLEVLKVGHHGSKSSSSDAFIEALKPQLSLISVGLKNNYGHPNGEVLETLNQWSNSVKMTSEQGQITISYKNDAAKVSSLVKE